MSERVKPSPLVLHDTMGLTDIVSELEKLVFTADRGLQRTIIIDRNTRDFIVRRLQRRANH